MKYIYKLEIKLKSSIKDKAEHIMLVDLARNDLGKVSKKGTVKVKSLMETQIYNNVIHLVSEVTGVITENKDFAMLLDFQKALNQVLTLNI